MTLFKDTEVFLSRGIKSLLFVVPFIPLYISPSIVFPYISGKNFAFRIIIELAAALWLVLVFINKKEWFRNSPMLIAVLSFAFIVGLANLFGVNPYRSFWSNFERMEGYITILHLLFYFMLLANVMKTKRDWKLFFGLFLAVSVLISVYALLANAYASLVDIKGMTRYAWEYGDRARSTIGNPPFLAAYLMLSIIVGAILIINEKRSFLKFIFALVVLLNSAIIYLTATRGVILGGVAGMIVFIALYILGRKKMDRKTIVRIVAVIILLSFACFSILLFALNSTEMPGQDRTLYRFKTMFSDHSGMSRLDVWERALAAIKERPLLGWGQENFHAVYSVSPIKLQTEYIWLDRAHNIIIDWLVNAGFLGLLSYILLFVLAVYYARKGCLNNRISKTEASVIVAGLVGYFAQNLFLFDTINTYMIFFALLAYINNFELFVKPTDEKQEYNIAVNNINVKFVSAFLTALLVFSVIFYHLNYKPIKQNRLAVKFSLINHEKLSTLSRDFEYLLSFNTFGNADVRERMLMISKFIMRKGLYMKEGALGFLQATSAELWKGIEGNRYDPEYFVAMIKYYTSIAEHEPSYIQLTESLINECIQISPGFQWLYMAKADVDILKKDYESAYQNVKKITEMYPENDIGLMKLALTAVLTSREEVVKETLEVVKAIRTSSSKRISSGKDPVFTVLELLQIADNYMLISDLQQALHYYTEITAMSEEYKKHIPKARYLRWMMEVYSKISKIYLALGEKEKAAEEAEKAKKLRYEDVSGRENGREQSVGLID